MNLPFANYTKEQSQFQDLIEPNSQKRILIFIGESGAGKTRLITNCLETISEHTPYLSIQLRGKDTTVTDVFYRLGRRIGWRHLHSFTKLVATFTNHLEAHSNPKWQNELRQHLEKLMQTESVNDKKNRHALLTDALFADFSLFQVPHLLIFDTYEQANTELDEWFNYLFLPWVSDTNNIRVLVAGQTVPKQNADWSHCCSCCQLEGVHDANAWLPIAKSMGRMVPSLDYLAGACAMANGNPSKILDFIRTLPLIGTLEHTHESTTATRKELRKNMVKSFDEQDIRDLCFDFNVDYESLGSSNNKRAKVNALITYMENRGRLQELITQYKELRPGVLLAK